MRRSHRNFNIRARATPGICPFSVPGEYSLIYKARGWGFRLRVVGEIEPEVSGFKFFFRALKLTRWNNLNKEI